MPQQETPVESLRDRLDRLMRELDEDSGDRPAMVDEKAFFLLVDEVEKDPATDTAMVEEAAQRFADHCLVPYLHSEDPVVLIQELSGLLEIHHRARLRLEELQEIPEGREAIVSITRITGEGPQDSPTTFDMQMVRHALATHQPGTRVQQLPAENPREGRFRIVLRR
jgi:hypothetical protein